MAKLITMSRKTFDNRQQNRKREETRVFPRIYNIKSLKQDSVERL